MPNWQLFTPHSIGFAIGSLLRAPYILNRGKGA